jgi:glycerol-3-phosphate dehydrogenase
MYDLLIVGGGINGAAIARDAAGRGRKVLLVEKDDLAQHTSSASSKLIHGGLRYLEQYEFRLVREALKEREILLRTAPHLVRPLRFVLPVAEGMRRPWMIRAGLKLYDLLSWGSSLPRSRGVIRSEEALREPLADPRARLFTYWDARVDDARLTVLNAVDARSRGAEIETRTEFVSARRHGDHWQALLSEGRKVAARAIVNAAGPWVSEILGRRLSEDARSRVRLVKGSHVVVPALYAGDHAYILQQPDGRVVFAIPYQTDFTLVGTTDVAVEAPETPTLSDEEALYLCEAVGRFFRKRIAPRDFVWSYAGVRALYDDGEAAAQEVTRDYHLELDGEAGAPPSLSVFGGKITTARALAEEALAKLGIGEGRWTAAHPFPGGDVGAFAGFAQGFAAAHPWLPAAMADRLAGAYGSAVARVVGEATSLEALGTRFGHDLFEAEVRYLIDHEFARSADDILWRRTKIGLRMSRSEQDAVANWMERH